MRERKKYAPLTAKETALVEDNQRWIDWLTAKWLPTFGGYLERDDLRATIAEEFCRASKTFDPNRGVLFGVYATRCAKNKLITICIRLDRSNRIVSMAPVDVADKAAPREERDVKLDVAAAIAKLKPKMAEAVRMHYFDGLPCSEIARRLGTKQQVIHARLKRARAILAILLKEYDPAPGSRNTLKKPRRKY